MKKTLLTFVLIFSFLIGFGQDEVFNLLIKQGIEFHDAGDYDRALEKYNEALKLKPNSSLAHYEIAYSYLSMENYKEAIKHSKIVIKNKDGFELQGFIIQGNALDQSGKPKKALKVYEEALKEHDNYMLHYNYAITCRSQGMTEQALQSTINAISNNASHASSHLLLSNLMENSGSRIKKMLPLYLFLLIEPNSARSPDAYQQLISHLDYGISKEDDKNINVSIPNFKGEDDFNAAEMMISLSRASNTMEENKDKNAYELFAENNNMIFSILGELKDEKEGFWWDLYVDFFYKIATEGHCKAFSYYISLSQDDAIVNDWLGDNQIKINAFFEMINQ